MSSNSQQLLNIVAKESLAFTGLALLYPFGIRKARIPVRTQAIACDQEIRDQSIVLVHGLAANRSCFLPLKTYLSMHGVKNILNFEYSSRCGIEMAARRLGEFVKIHAQSKKICFIGHSLGGVIAQTYIQMLGGHRKTGRLVSIGSPHQGTYNAYWLPTKVGYQLRPGSILYDRLAGSQGVSSHIPYSSIAADSDNIILPRESAKQWQTHSIKGVGHLGLLWSPAMMNLILRFIQNDSVSIDKGINNG